VTLLAVRALKRRVVRVEMKRGSSVNVESMMSDVL